MAIRTNALLPTKKLAKRFTERSLKEKCEALTNKSVEVFRDVVQENGAIVAANSKKSTYPREAKNYFFVWPRDAAFICVAATMLGISDIQERFFCWLNKFPEGFQDTGLLFANYSIDGKKIKDQFQPDQAGSMLWALHEFFIRYPKKASEYESLVHKLAQGLCHAWDGDSFALPTIDLWEEWRRKTLPRMKNNFTYSLGACAHGLRLAHSLFPNTAWEKAARSMQKKVEEAYSDTEKFFFRNHGTIDDNTPDSSLLGLVYPQAHFSPLDPRMITTVRVIEKMLMKDGGVYRFPYDYYDGEGDAQEGAGAWTLLNFWLSIYYSLAKKRGKAIQSFLWVLDRINDDLFIPEQIFTDSRQGVKPLAWSHAMFIIAASYLGIIDLPTHVKNSKNPL